MDCLSQLLYLCLGLISDEDKKLSKMAQGSPFTKVYTRRISTATVKTDKTNNNSKPGTKEYKDAPDARK